MAASRRITLNSDAMSGSGGTPAAMAYRYGIPAVTDSRQERYGRTAIDRSPQPFVSPLACGKCGVAVHAVPSHIRTGKAGATTAVAAHYRLNPGVEHAPDCDYDFARRVNGIRTDSHGTVLFEQDCWRLLLPAAFEAESINSPALTAGEQRQRQQIHIEASTTRLRPALNSARAITRLLDDFEHDSDLVDRFRVSYQDKTIAWRDFYFTDTTPDRARLADRLQAAGGKLTHPVAVAGTLHALKTGKNGGSKAAHARGGIRCPDGNGWIPIVLRATNPDLLPNEQGQQWLAYGDWRRWTADTGYTEIRLWLHGRWQIQIS